MSVPEKEVLKFLNIVLSNQLTAINQYFLHARMMKHMGVMKLADNEYKESIQQMKHADRLVERVLALGGIPNLQDLRKLRIGKTVEEILKCDLETEKAMTIELKTAISLCESEGDNLSTEILRSILGNEGEHTSFVREQLNLIDSMGLSQYLQTQA